MNENSYNLDPSLNSLYQSRWKIVAPLPRLLKLETQKQTKFQKMNIGQNIKNNAPLDSNGTQLYDNKDTMSKILYD